MGFSLTELLYIMLLIGILVTFAIPSINPGKYQLDAAVVEVATGLMAAQRTAVLRGHDVVVAFYRNDAVLRIHNDENNDGAMQSTELFRVFQLPEGAAFGRAGAPKLREFPGDPVTFTQLQDGLPTVTFHRNGSASEEGIIYLTGTRGRAQPENTRAVHLSRATAKIKCWSYDTRSWRETC